MNAFIFDMDGVLADNSDYHVQAWTLYARQLNKVLTVDEIKQRLGFNNREYMRFLLNREPTEVEVTHSTVEKEALYRQVYTPHLAHPPGLLPLLAFARQVGIPCAVATSAPEENVRFVLDGLSLRSYFKQVVDSSHVTHGKPDPEIYLLASKRLGVAPSDCLVFEDAIAGIQSARRAGMPVIALTTTYPADILMPHQPSAIINSFTDLASRCPATDLISSHIQQPLTLE